MKERLLKTTVAKYQEATWTGTNTSEWAPVGGRVVVLPDSAEQVTQGGIEIPMDVVARHTMASEAGVLIAIGPLAFAEYEIKPQPGDRVYIERFAGQLLPGYDGKVYRLMDYQCIGAVMKKEQVNG